MNGSHKPTARGFTLLETLVAIAILMLAVAGPLYVADRTLVAAQVSQDQLTASYLAQEAIEYVRSMRDHEFLFAYKAGGTAVSTSAWQAFAYGGAGSGQGGFGACLAVACTYDPLKATMGVGGTLATCAAPCNKPLYLTNDLTNGRVYTQQTTIAGSTKTPYVRTVTGSLISTNDMQVISTVTWKNRGTSYSVTATDNLTPWQ